MVQIIAMFYQNKTEFNKTGKKRKSISRIYEKSIPSEMYKNNKKA